MLSGRSKLLEDEIKREYRKRRDRDSTACLCGRFNSKCAINSKNHMKESLKPYMLRTGESVPGCADGVKASISSTAGGFTMIESRTAGGAPWHVHSREDEYFYVVDGEITVWCGKEEFHAGPRSFVFLPRGVPHAWDVTSTEKATVLMMTVPAMLEEFLREFHAAKPDQRVAVAQKYGLTFFAGRPV
jgi:mannose-6-phosphate isomerase-like protein (cupin superfamily)